MSAYSFVSIEEWERRLTPSPVEDTLLFTTFALTSVPRPGGSNMSSALLFITVNYQAPTLSTTMSWHGLQEVNEHSHLSFLLATSGANVWRAGAEIGG